MTRTCAFYKYILPLPSSTASFATPVQMRSLTIFAFVLLVCHRIHVRFVVARRFFCLFVHTRHFFGRISTTRHGTLKNQQNTKEIKTIQNNVQHGRYMCVSVCVSVCVFAFRIHRQ